MFFQKHGFIEMLSSLKLRTSSRLFPMNMRALRNDYCHKEKDLSSNPEKATEIWQVNVDFILATFFMFIVTILSINYPIFNSEKCCWYHYQFCSSSFSLSSQYFDYWILWLSSIVCNICEPPKLIITCFHSYEYHMWYYIYIYISK